MKKVLLSCMAVAAGAAIAMAQEPVFPETIDYTINGQTELAGVDVVINNGDWGPTMTVTGESDAKTITLSFAVPEGWDGWIINADHAEVSEQDFVKTRGEYDWQPLDLFLDNMGYKKGNSVTFAVEEEDNYATLALYKDDQVYDTTLTIEYNVVPAGGVVSTDPVFPESVGVSTYAEGLVEEQTNEDDNIFIELTGEIEESTFDVILDVPEGWEGFISKVQSGDVIIDGGGGSGIDPKMTRSEEDWMPLEEALAADGVQGNKFTFIANGERNHVEVYLYKGEEVYTANSITLTANVKKYVDPELAAANQAAYDDVIAQLDALQEKYDAAVAEIKEKNPGFDFSEWEEVIGNMIPQYKEWAAQALAAANEDGSEFQFAFDSEEFNAYITMMILEGTPAPAYPESYDVTLSDNVGVEVNDDIEPGIHIISVSGKSLQEEITLTIAVPEGWDGFVCMSEMNSEIQPLSTRAQETEWWPVDDILNAGGVESNSITFPVDGEEHAAQFMLVKDGLVDVANQINVEFYVEYDFIAANQVAFDKVMDEINAANANYTEAINFIQSYNPDFDLTEMKEIIENAISEAQTGAEQALNVANEEGEAFFYPFSAEEINAMVAEMKAQAVAGPNEAAYKETLAAIEKSEAEYEKTLKELKDANPDFDFKEWEEIIEYVLNDAKKEAEKALNSANENGTAYEYAYDGKEIEALLKEMSEEVKTSGIAGVNAADNASYYDLNGNKINNPKAGMYIKVVDGKSTKVVVK